MPPTTSWKRFAEEVEIGLGLGVVQVEFNKEDFCLFGLDGLIFTRRMAQRQRSRQAHK